MRRVASLYALFGGLDVARMAARTGLPVALVGRVYYAAGARFQIDWPCAQASALSLENARDREAVSAIVEDLSDVQGDLAEHVLRHAVGRHEQTVGDLRAAAGIEMSAGGGEPQRERPHRRLDA